MLLLADPTRQPTSGSRTPRRASCRRASWPGGLTLVAAAAPRRDPAAVLTGGASTIGVRVPDHPAPRALASAARPDAGDSANVSGMPTPATAAEIVEALGAAVDLVLDGGPARGERPSTVVDCSGARPRLLREGAIPAAALAAVLDEAELPHDLLRRRPPRRQRRELRCGRSADDARRGITGTAGNAREGGPEMTIAGRSHLAWATPRPRSTRSSGPRWRAERRRQRGKIELIASENYTSRRGAWKRRARWLTNKYAEGLPGKRYYGGCEYVDIAERLAQERALALFPGAEHVNVQPHAGAQANMAAYFAVLDPGDRILG